MTYVFLIIGFGLLIKGADFFVDGSSNIARLLRVPPMIIGLTIVALGTSSPEATVSIIASLQENSGVSLGNVVGSNIFNLTLVVGITAFISPLSVEDETVRKEIPFTLLASMALFVLIGDTFLQGTATNVITRSDGLIFLLFFIVFMYYAFEVARKSRNNKTADDEKAGNISWGKNLVFTILGLAGIIYGGQLVVTNSTEIAYKLGMSETLVGLTVVAFGTSLPELVTSITAAVKKEAGIALGNVVGSNIFNILFVLGTASIVSPMMITDSDVFIDIVIMMVLTVFLLIFSRTQYKVKKAEGVVLVLFYLGYLTYIILRNYM
ncbi:calcium/sodium antiporter [Virgibacillus sp. W0430]|uniref:calcium/sodium antiporter n=1 Tax=Virgibacillus sp. W0430 TaxID=3391580 RepID=UPI003F47EE41